MFCLRIFNAGESRLATLQEPALTLGSDPDNEIVLIDPEIPTLALRLTQTMDGYSVASAHPKTKAELNGKKLAQASLRIGDILQLGSHRLVFDKVETVSPSPSLPTRPPVGGGIPPGLSQLCSLVAEERDLKVLLSKIMHLLLKTFGGHEALLFTLDETGNPAVAVSTKEGDVSPLFSDTVVTQVLRSRQGLFVANALSHPTFSNSQSILALKLQSVLCCPILAAGRISGLIYLGSNRPTVSFGQTHLQELEVYSLVVGCLLNHLGYIAMQSKILASLQQDNGGQGIIASSPGMQRVLEEARAVAQGDISVLLEGETGTGKDVLAHYIHGMSRRSSKPFLVINCSTLRGELLASELFGHKKGAFTGALQDQKGLFQSADGGTLFLDEIGEMELSLQAMLLRTLESGMIRPVGQAAEIRVNVRILCATNRNLSTIIEEGLFRQDLYYRINQHCMTMPPLRERGEDITLLAHYFLERAKTQYPDKNLSGFHPQSLFEMIRYRWPGNVRELGNIVSKAALFATSPVIRISLPENKERWMDMEEATRRFQMDYLERALSLSGGDKDKAAALLGMGRSTFFRYLAQAK